MLWYQGESQHRHLKRIFSRSLALLVFHQQILAVQMQNREVPSVEVKELLVLYWLHLTLTPHT